MVRKVLVENIYPQLKQCWVLSMTFQWVSHRQCWFYQQVFCPILLMEKSSIILLTAKAFVNDVIDAFSSMSKLTVIYKSQMIKISISSQNNKDIIIIFFYVIHLSQNDLYVTKKKKPNKNQNILILPILIWSVT